MPGGASSFGGSDGDEPGYASVMTWQRLDRSDYAGPIVAASIRVPRTVPLTTPLGEPLPDTVQCLALLDTGATHSILDLDHVAATLQLQAHDTRRMAFAGLSRAEAPVYEVGVSFPDFPLPERMIRVSGLRLPGPFALLVGVDLLRGTRFAMEWSDDGPWLRWEPLSGPTG